VIISGMILYLISCMV